MAQRKLERLVFLNGFDALEEELSERRGYRSHVWAELADGRRYQLTFYDLTRLAQTLEDERSAGRPFVVDPGLVILERVTLANMQAAAESMVRLGCFDEGKTTD